MFFRGLFISSSPNFIWETLTTDWYMEWLSTVGHWYPVFPLDLRTLPLAEAWMEDILLFAMVL
jgi:hypothetical protein